MGKYGKLIKIAALCCALCTLSGCLGGEKASDTAANASSASDSEAVQTQNVTEAAAEPEEQTETQPKLSPEEYRRLAVESAVISTGNTRRLKKAFEKAASGKELTVAYIGGSITEGYNVDKEKCYAKLSYDFLCEKYPDTIINYVNAGMSGTPSMLGMIRADRDVLSPYGDPDIVFIEFAVNDAQDSVSKEAYESLVRRMLSLSSDTAVILLFTRTADGYSCQKHMSTIGYNYGLPMISLNDALSGEIDAGRMSWADYSDDEAHPNINGSRFIADMIEYLYDCAENGTVREGSAEGWDKDVTDISAVAPIYGDAYINTHMYDRTTLTPVSLGEYSDDRDTIAQFPCGWVRKGGENTGITFEMSFKSLFIVYQCNNNKKYGTAEVFVDGEPQAQIQSYAADGWNNPVPKLILRSDELKTHTVEIKMKEGQEDTFFGLLAFGYTQ